MAGLGKGIGSPTGNPQNVAMMKEIILEENKNLNYTKPSYRATRKNKYTQENRLSFRYQRINYISRCKRQIRVAAKESTKN
jgi:hypothetical protein